jgi:hypothetical protein
MKGNAGRDKKDEDEEGERESLRKEYDDILPLLAHRC